MKRQPGDTSQRHTARSPRTAGLRFLPRRHSGVLELDMGDGLVLYNPASSLVHHLNPSAGVVWRLCDGAATVDDIALEIAEAYAVDRGEITAQVRTLVAQLDDLGLVGDGCRTGDGGRGDPMRATAGTTA